MDTLDRPLHFCPVCYSVLGRGGPQQCHHCREYVSEPVQMTSETFADLERSSCPECAKAVPTAARVCPECGADMSQAAGNRPTLPERHQLYYDHHTWEDSRLFVPLPADSEPPDIEDIVERLGLGGIEVDILSTNPPSTIGSDDSKWEFEFLAALEGVEVREAWVVDDYGTGYETGERYNMWLMRTPEGISGFDVLLSEVSDAQAEYVANSDWTIGLNGYCSTDPAETFRFQTTVARFAAADETPIIDETAGRFIDAERVQRIVRKRARIEDTYEIYTVRGEDGHWLHTGGLPRIGGFELEMLRVPPDREREAADLIRSAAQAFCDRDRPTPYRVHDLGSRTRYIWAPIDDVTPFFEGARGTSSADRSRLIFPSAVLVTETLHPEAFAAAKQAFESGGTTPGNHPSDAPKPDASSPDSAQQKFGPRHSPQQGAQEHAPPASGSGAPMQQHSPGAAAPPIIAGLASLVFPGVGQLLVGQTAKGIVLLVCALSLMVFTCGVSILFHPIFAVDAYMLADKARKGGHIGEWQFF